MKPCHIIKKDTWKSEWLLDIPHLLYTLNIYMVGFWDSCMRCGDKHGQKFRYSHSGGQSVGFWSSPTGGVVPKCFCFD
jgi:hypothetical protein